MLLGYAEHATPELIQKWSVQVDITGKNALVLGGFGLVGIAVCRELLAHEPKTLVIASLKKSESEQAIAELKEALEICQDCRSRGDLHKNLGLIYGRSGDLEHAEQQLRLALELKPNDADILKSLKIIETLRKKNRPESAVAIPQ